VSKVNLGRMQRPKSGGWMTFNFIAEMKNAPIGSKLESFLAKIPY